MDAEQIVRSISRPLGKFHPIGTGKRASLDLTFGSILLNLRSLRPCVLRIAAYQFSPDLRVEALPESSKVRGPLHRAMIRRKKMDDERRPIRADPRRLLHPKEVLQAG